MAVKGEIYYNKNDGKYYTPDGTGGWQIVDVQTLAQADLAPAEIVANEQGLPGLAGAFNRWKLMSFGVNAEEDKRYLSDELKLNVVQYGDGPYEFGVEHPDGKIRLVDPNANMGKFQTAEGKASFLDYPLAAVFSDSPLATVKSGIVEDFRRAEEFMRDMLDISVAAVEGTIIAAGTVGGAFAAPITGAGSAALTELGRQKIGQALGITREVDPSQVAISGAVGGGIPAAGHVVRMARGLAKKGKEVGKEAIARLVVKGRGGGPSASEVTDVELLDMRVLDPAKAGEKLPAVSEAVNSVRRSLAKASAEDFPESVVVRNMERNTDEGIDFIPLMDDLSRLTKTQLMAGPPVTSKTIKTTTERVGRRAITVRGKPMGTLEQPTGIAGARKTTSALEREAAGEAERTTSKITFRQQEVPASVEAAIDIGVDSNLPSQMKTLIGKVYTVLNAAGIQDVRDVPAALSRRILRMTQDIADNMQAYDDKPITGRFKHEVKQFSRKLRSQIERVVDASGQTDPATGKKYSALMSKIDSRMRQLKYWNHAMGVTKLKFDRTGNVVGVDSISDKIGRKKAAQTIRNFYGDDHHAIIKMARQFQDDFGMDILTPIRRSALGTRIGDQGALSAFPNITAVGGVPLAGRVTALGFPLLAGLGVGGITRNPLAGLAAGGAAGTLSSPQFLVGALKSGQRIPAPVRQAAGQLGPLTEGTQAVLTSPSGRALSNALASAMRRLRETEQEE